MFLAQRAFGSDVDTHYSHLNGIFVLLVVAVTQFHVKDSGYGISIFGRKCSGEKIRVSKHL